MAELHRTLTGNELKIPNPYIMTQPTQKSSFGPDEN
jgi:hypothetical protein